MESSSQAQKTQPQGAEMKTSSSSSILYALLIISLLLLLTTTTLLMTTSSSSSSLFSNLLLVHQHQHQLPNNNTLGPASKNISKWKVEDDDDDKVVGGGGLGGGLNETSSSCLSRYHLTTLMDGSSSNNNNGRKRPPPPSPSPYLISRLRNYESHYKQCGPNTEPYNKILEMLTKSGTSSSSSSAGEEEYYNSGAATGAGNCKYVIWAPMAGLGNRMMTLASTFLYALLTDRVLFIVQDEGNNIPDLFCEPFPEVSWLLPSHFPIREFYKLNRSHPYSYGNMLLLRRRRKRRSNPPPFVLLHLSHDYDEHDKLFFCDQDQAYLQNIPWLIVKSDQYFLPGLFLIHSFQQELNSLFPQDQKDAVFHHLARYLFHPSNSVWALITSYYQTYLLSSNSNNKNLPDDDDDVLLLGLQIREFHDRGHNVTFDTILNQVLACTVNHNLLPQIINNTVQLPDDKKQQLVENPKKKRTNVLVTSLNSGYYDKLRDMYWEYGTVTGEVIAFHQPSHEQEQRSGNKMHDRKALAEVYLLSMSDKLVTSGWSTFGYVAQSLGGLQPWILYTPMDANVPDPPCQLALSMEPCFHFAPSHLSCRGKGGIHNDTSNTVPHVKHCEDVGMGLKLV